MSELAHEPCRASRAPCRRRLLGARRKIGIASPTLTVIAEPPWNNQAPRAFSQVLRGEAVDTAAVFNAMNRDASTSQGAIGCLAGRLPAVEFNRANGADSTPCIDSTTASPSAFLSGGTVNGVPGVAYTRPRGSYTLSAAERALAISLKSALDELTPHSLFRRLDRRAGSRGRTLSKARRFLVRIGPIAWFPEFACPRSVLAGWYSAPLMTSLRISSFVLGEMVCTFS
jgi:hypothetical protein